MLVICLLSWRRNSKVRVKKCIFLLFCLKDQKRAVIAYVAIEHILQGISLMMPYVD